MSGEDIWKAVWFITIAFFSGWISAWVFYGAP